MKTLTWHYAGPLHTDAHDLSDRRGGGALKVLDGRYRPVATRVTLGVASHTGPVSFDIQDDTTSIFGDKPGVQADVVDGDFDIFAAPPTTNPDGASLAELELQDPRFSLVILAGGNGAKALTVELDLEEL